MLALVSGACFADFGHDVICIDKGRGQDRAAAGRGIPIFEPGLDVLVAQNVKGRCACPSTPPRPPRR